MLAARGTRVMDAPEEAVTDPVARVLLRRRSRRVVVLALALGGALAVLAYLLPS